jgi:hypothetical protein
MSKLKICIFKKKEYSFYKNKYQNLNIKDRKG